MGFCYMEPLILYLIGLKFLLLWLAPYLMIRLSGGRKKFFLSAAFGELVRIRMKNTVPMQLLLQDTLQKIYYR
jgi:hypothetical protein